MVSNISSEECQWISRFNNGRIETVLINLGDDWLILLEMRSYQRHAPRLVHYYIGWRARLSLNEFKSFWKPHRIHLLAAFVAWLMVICTLNISETSWVKFVEEIWSALDNAPLKRRVWIPKSGFPAEFKLKSQSILFPQNWYAICYRQLWIELRYCRISLMVRVS